MATVAQLPPSRQELRRAWQTCQDSARQLRFQVHVDDFLDLNGPNGAALPGDSRRKFFRDLGLDKKKFLHCQLYQKMKSEARAGSKRLQLQRTISTTSASSDDASPSYGYDFTAGAAFRREVCNIYRTASPSTRGVYELVRTSPHDEDNWVIRWLLHHVMSKHRQAHDQSSATSAAETESSMPSLTSDKTVSTPHARSPLPKSLSNASWSVAGGGAGVGAADSESDSDAWSFPEPAWKRRKRRHSALDEAATPTRSVYWSHVMT